MPSSFLSCRHLLQPLASLAFFSSSSSSWLYLLVLFRRRSSLRLKRSPLRPPFSWQTRFFLGAFIQKKKKKSIDTERGVAHFCLTRSPTSCWVFFKSFLLPPLFQFLEVCYSKNSLTDRQPRVESKEKKEGYGTLSSFLLLLLLPSLSPFLSSPNPLSAFLLSLQTSSLSSFSSSSFLAALQKHLKLSNTSGFLPVPSLDSLSLLLLFSSFCFSRPHLQRSSCAWQFFSFLSVSFFRPFRTFRARWQRKKRRLLRNNRQGGFVALIAKRRWWMSIPRVD